MDSDELNLDEELDEFLMDIEKKYGGKKNRNKEIDAKLGNLLTILSEDFDTVGLEPIEQNKEISQILYQVATNSHILIQMYRNELTNIRDKNLENTQRNHEIENLRSKIQKLKIQLNKSEEKHQTMENKCRKIQAEYDQCKKNETNAKTEILSCKRYYRSKENEMTHNIKRVEKENGRLKEIFREDIGKYTSNNEVALKIKTKFEQNEKTYKKIIKTLEENNRELISEVLDLKEKLSLHEC